MRKACAPGVLVDVDRVTVCINAANLTELLVVGDDGQVLLHVGFKALLDSVGVVVGATLATAHEALNAGLL